MSTTLHGHECRTLWGNCQGNVKEFQSVWRVVTLNFVHILWMGILSATAAENFKFVVSWLSYEGRKKGGSVYRNTACVVWKWNVVLCEWWVKCVVGVVGWRCSLEEVRKALQERVQRWRVIERICAFDIISNPGLTALDAQLKPVLRRGITSHVYINIVISLSYLSLGDFTFDLS